YAAYLQAPRWSVRERLRGERDTLGLYVTGHPIDDYEQEVARLTRSRIAGLRPDDEPQRVVGLVVAVRTMKSKRGEDIAFVQLDDRTARIEVSLFADTYRSCRECVVRDGILVVEGVVSVDEYSGGGLRMRAQEAYTLAEARRRFARELVLQLEPAHFTADFAASFGRLLGNRRNREGCRVRVFYRSGGAQAEITLGEQWRVQPSDEAIGRLRERFGAGNVTLAYA
ncbi:MAG: OB-fold nucleic acid binding domain-containing protein, partial [Gammaproteobacteria bacterium]